MPAVPSRRSTRAGLALLSALATLTITVAHPAGADPDASAAPTLVGGPTTPMPTAPLADAPTYDWRAGGTEDPARLITTTPMPVSGGGDLVVDAARQRIYMSGNDRILVLDFAGNIVQTLTGHSGATSMVLEGSTLYVLEASSVMAVDVSGTPTNGATVVTGLPTPFGLAYANGALFTTVGPCVSASSPTGTAAVARINPGGNSWTTFPTTALSGLRCPSIDAKGNHLVVGDSGTTASLSRWDVSAPMPSPVTSTTISPATSIMHVSIDQPTSTVTVSLGLAQPSQTRDLTTLGVTTSYAAAPVYGSASTTARGGMIVLGGYYAPNIMLYQRGNATPLWSVTVGDYVLDVDFDPAGSKVFAFVLELDTAGVLQPRLVIIDVDDPTFPEPSHDGEFHPVDPTRVFDSRATQRVTDTKVKMTGLGGVPATNVSAVAVNITVTDVVSAGYLSVYPSGTPRPNASTLNFRLGQTVPNMAIVGLGADGALALFASAPAHVIVDVVGWFGDATAPKGSVFHAITPTRWFDTRTFVWSDGTTRPAGRGMAAGVHMSFWKGAAPITAASLNVTATNTTSESYLTVLPYNGKLGSSNLNWKAGEVVPNSVISRLDAQYGAMSFVNAFGTTDVIADATGYWDDGSVFPGYRFHPVAPLRLADTRIGYIAPNSLSQNATRIEAGGLISFKANGGLPTGVVSAVLNVTAVSPAAAGYLSVYPTGLDPVKGSKTSLINFSPDDVRPNMTIMSLGTNGEVVVVNNSAGPIDVLVDITGYFS